MLQNFADISVFRQKHRKIGNYFDFLKNRKNKNKNYSFQICCKRNGLECNLKSCIMVHFRLHKKPKIALKLGKNWQKNVVDVIISIWLIKFGMEVIL